MPELTDAELLSITDDWDQTNERRMELIHKKIDGTIEAEEARELAYLQGLADSRIRLLAPLPTRELRDRLSKREPG